MPEFKKISIVVPIYNEEKTLEKIIVPSPEENSWYADLVKDKPYDIQFITNNFLEPSDKKYGLAVNVESKDFAGIWKVK